MFRKRKIPSILLVAVATTMSFFTSSNNSKLFFVTGTYYGRYGGYTTNNNYGNSDLSLEVCSGSVVSITAMTIQCDSPYTFYYGNGAHRNSPICDYGDKVSLHVSFDVIDNLQDDDDEIYFTMASYDDNQNLLSSTYPEKLCTDYVGSDCTKQGSYNFTYKMKFQYPQSNNADRSQFVPDIQIAFSTNSNSGYNLGAVNIQCQDTDESYITWREPITKKEKFHNFIANYGIFIVTVFTVSSFIYFIYIQQRYNGTNSLLSCTLCSETTTDANNNNDNSSSRRNNNLGYDIDYIRSNLSKDGMPQIV